MYAFPSGHNPKTGIQQIGMTMRDYFAAKAMYCIDDAESAEELARAAYAVADAMMKARDL